MPVTKQRWERAEVARSEHEALRTCPAGVACDERQIARYLTPAANSAFPLEFLFSLVGDIRGRRVLDLGCGTGENSVVLARRGATVVGIDISDPLLELARRRLETAGVSERATFVVGSGHDLPVQSGSIDLVFGAAILHHLDLDLVSREVFRVLKHGGRGVFKEPVRDLRVLRVLRKAIPYRSPDVSPFERPLTAQELHEFASRFRIETARRFSLPFVNVMNAVAPQSRHLNTLYRLDRSMLEKVPALGSLAGIQVFSLKKAADAV